MDPFIGKALSAVTLDDVMRLKEDSVSENAHLDYKEVLCLATPNEKKEFLRDITAFANTDGGTIIFGISENRDENSKPNGLPEDIAGFQVENTDALGLTIENILKDGVDERLARCEMRWLKKDDGRSLLIMRIPASLRAPHMVILDGERRFHIRGNNGKQPMSTSQIRDSVLRTEGILKQFNDLVKVREEKWARLWQGKPFWLMHVVPLAPNRSAIDVTNPACVAKLNALKGLNHGVSGFCLEGYRTRAAPQGFTYQATVFRDGSVEVVDERSLSRDELQALYLQPEYMCMFAFGALKAMIDLYDLGFVQFPVAVAISMHQVRGCFLDKKKWPFMSSPSECAIDDDHVLVDPIVVVEKPDDPKSALRPLFDIIWNAFGYPRCYLYDEHGNYVV